MSINLKSVQSVASRKDAQGMAITFDISSGSRVSRIEFDLIDDGILPRAYDLPAPSDGREVRGWWWKGYGQEGSFRFTITARDTAGCAATAVWPTPVTVVP